MPAANTTVSQIEIKIDGTALTNDTMNLLQEVVVDQSTSLPHMFTLHFRDHQMELIDDAKFKPTKPVEISVVRMDDEQSMLIFKGEITAVEPQFREGMLLEMIVRGYDKSHRMYRQVKSRTFMNKKDSDIASEIAGEYGLSTEVETTTAVYDHVFQHNQTDLAFLMERAWRIGYECFVDEEKLYFRKPPASGGAAATLTWGQDLLDFFPTMSLAEQVDEVIVRGWDVQKKEAIVGKASSGELYAQNGEQDGKSQASSLGTGKKIVVNLPVVSQAEADTLAQARLNEISGAFIQASGTALRRPNVRAGQVVELADLGTRFSGKYFVTTARHIYRDAGFETEFEARGLRSGSFGEQLLHQEPVERWPGAVVATVTDTSDPEGMGRVKVLYPWMSSEHNSCWARVISPGAGPEAGLFMVPEIGDEVMVVFEQGDFDRPYVLGGVWNGQDKVPPPGAGAASNEKPKVRTWHSLTGHHISVYDNADNKIEIVTAGGHQFVLSDTDKKIELTSSNGQQLLVDDSGNSIKVSTDGSITIESTGNMTFKASANVKIEAGALMDLKAGGTINIKGAMVNLN
jgi:uncharacterized protein involved in type VI secretion and phage assembly